MAVTAVPPGPPAVRRNHRRARLWVGGALIAAGIGAVVFQGLGDATVYFRTVDEAVAQSDSLGSGRFRLLGTVVPGSVRLSADGVAFEVEHSGERLRVLHRGDPPELFQPGIEVVLEGRLAAGADEFESDRIMVKHSAEYRESNPDRVSPGAP